jgi:hypothetical protein
MVSGRLFNTLLALFSLTAATAAAQTTTTIGTVTSQTSTPAVGLASSEIAQINVANLAAASSSGKAASCTGTISFVNASGTVIGSATPFTVTGGQIFSAALPFNKAGASGTRTEFRGIVALTETLGGGATLCALSSSLETYDSSSGATHVYLVIGSPALVAQPVVLP